MGLNFYWVYEKDIKVIPEGFQMQGHIGKRHLAGWYCWDCEVPLVQGGKWQLVHMSYNICVDVCPKCEKAKPSHNTVDKEYRTLRPKGIQICCSFSWAQEPPWVVSVCQRRKDEQIIEDENGLLVTGQQFLDLLDRQCPIQFTDSIGSNFD